MTARRLRRGERASKTKIAFKIAIGIGIAIGVAIGIGIGIEIATGIGIGITAPGWVRSPPLRGRAIPRHLAVLLHGTGHVH